MLTGGNDATSERRRDRAAAQALSGWKRDGDAIVKDFKLSDFKGSVDFVNAITPLAEEMNHDPDLKISWNAVSVSSSTHSEGGLTESDFELAGKIDAVGGA
ncbi:MAG TPA: 4a-hydroxytetrahydrobiopterin dehydratase [Thermoleophilaceae bacterium]|nr:4a-hydroxytetrahydrobiopterin dehydratase [Thermoleophilaceae bacterium]